MTPRKAIVLWLRGWCSRKEKWKDPKYCHFSVVKGLVLGFSDRRDRAKRGVARKQFRCPLGGQLGSLLV